ncbi:MAG: hypothetical protein ACREQZ_09380 [Woeseiaceae bacterium]
MFRAGGMLDDTILLRPRLIAAHDGWVFAYDYGDQRVKALDPGGRLRWSFGRRGQGPGEFANPFDIEVGADGRLWVLDAGTARITVLTPSGTFAREFRLDRVIRSLVPRTEDAIVLTSSLDPFWFLIDFDSKILATGDPPVGLLEKAPPFARQALTARSSTGSTWVAAFPYGDLFLVYDDLELRCWGWLVEGRGFPETPGANLPIWAAGIAASDASVFVLARGETPERLGILDVYSTADCSYETTLRLPRRMSAIAHAGGVFYFEYEDPVPSIIGLRLSNP